MMFKNQLQELAQRSCFNLPSYTCIREGPDHAPWFKASVNFNGEIFESPTYFTTLRQAEHAAAQVALIALSASGPSRSLTARVLDESGVYKNLLQETAHRAGLELPVYTTVRSGPGHLPVFTTTVELAGMNFTGDPAKTKKQAEKNAAIAAWSAFKTTPNLINLCVTSKEEDNLLECHQDDQMTMDHRRRRGLASIRHGDEIIRKKYENRSRRRLVMKKYCSGCNDSKNNTSNISGGPDHHQEHLAVNATKQAACSSSTQKHNNQCNQCCCCCCSSVSSLPISHDPSSRTTCQPVHVSSAEPTTSTNSPTSVELLGDDEDEWLKGGRRELIKMMIKKPNEKEGPLSINSSFSSAIPPPSKIYRPLHTHSPPIAAEYEYNDEAEEMLQASGACPFTPQQVAPLKVSTSSSTCSKIQMVSTGASGAACHHPYRNRNIRIAPAVQIRSVIPVCAAPPALPSSSDPSLLAHINKGEAFALLSSSSSTSSKLKSHTRSTSTTQLLSSSFTKIRL